MKSAAVASVAVASRGFAGVTSRSEVLSPCFGFGALWARAPRHDPKSRPSQPLESTKVRNLRAISVRGSYERGKYEGTRDADRPRLAVAQPCRAGSFSPLRRFAT